MLSLFFTIFFYYIWYSLKKLIMGIFELNIGIGVKWFKRLNKKMDVIMGTQKELAVKLDAVATQVEKVRTEVESVKQALLDSLNVDPEVQAAFDRLESAVQGVDDLNEDSTTGGGGEGEGEGEGEGDTEL